MCELCITSALTICEPIKGWDLVVARENGMFSQIRQGDFGLVDLNNSQDIGIVIPKEVMPIKAHVTWEEFTHRLVCISNSSETECEFSEVYCLLFGR